MSVTTSYFQKVIRVDEHSPEPLDLPLLPTYAEGTYLLLLPGLDKNKLKDWTYDYDPDDDLLMVKCYYGGLDSDGQIDGVTYPVNVTDQKRELIDKMETLLVQNPLQVDLEEYFDSENADKLRIFFKKLENKYSQ